MDNLEKKKKGFLNQNIFSGLQNLNDGFDAKGIFYFSEKDFEEVLNRIKKYSLGIYGIEPWKNGEFFDVLVYEDFANDPTDSTWYFKAFESFKATKQNLQFAATYYIPKSILL